MWSSSILRVGMVEAFDVKHGIVRIQFRVSMPTYQGGSYSAGVTFDDRLHSLRVNPPNRFFTHGISGLGSVVFRIIDAEHSHQLEPTEIVRLKTGWSYPLDPSEDDETTEKITPLKPVNRLP